MAGVKPKGGKKNRKHGTTKKKPAQQRYVADKRSEKNKARKIAKANAWRSWCGKVRAAAAGKVRDMGRQVRKLRRAK
jgi:hypothetical protein